MDRVRGRHAAHNTQPQVVAESGERPPRAAHLALWQRLVVLVVVAGVLTGVAVITGSEVPLFGIVPVLAWVGAGYSDRR